MSVETTASLNLEGSGSLKEYLEDLSKNMGDLNKVTKTQTTEFEKLNKVGEDTSEYSKTLLDTLKEIYETTTKFTKQGKDSFNFLKDTGENTIKLNEGLESASTGLSGFGLRLLGVRDDVVRLNNVIETPARHFRDIAEAQGATAKAFVILDKTSRPIIKSLNFLSDQVDNLGNALRDAEQFVASFAQTTLNIGARSMEFFSNSFSNLSENLKNSGLVGRMFAGSMQGVAKTLEDGAKSATEFAKSIDPRDLVLVDEVGNRAADTLGKVGRGLDRLAVGVRLADLTGDIVRLGTNTRDTATAIAQDFGDAVSAVGPPTVRFGQVMASVVTKMQLASGAAKLLAFTTGSQLAGALGGVLGKLSLLSIQATSFVQLGNAAADAFLQSQGLNDAFDTMQRMGIDTTAAAIAFQFGLVGEKLILSANAAKEFGKTAITAFAALEDSAAFVTTLGAGANIQFQNLEKGVDSISAAMTRLASGPLQNTITSTEAAAGLYNALSAGVGVAADNTVRLSETQDFLTASLKLSSATGADAAQTLELLAKTSTVYGLSNSQAAETASKLYQVVERGITTFPELTAGMGRALVTARGLGVEFDEALGSVTALTQIMGSDEALTGFAGLMANIAGQGEQASQQLAELGIKFDANSIKTKGLIASLDELYEATGGNASLIKRIIPDMRAYRTAMILMTSASERAAEATKAVGEAGEDTLERVFDARQQSTIKQFEIIMNGFNEVLVDFGRRALPAIQPGVDFLSKLLDILQSLPEPLKDVIGAIVIAQTAISNIGGGLLSFALSLGQVIAALTIFRLLFKLGNLKNEWMVLKEINKDGLDFAGTLLRLVGLNNNLDVATAQLNKTLRIKKDLISDLANTGIDFEGDIASTVGLNNALLKTQKKLEDTRKKLETLSNVARTDDAAIIDLKNTEKEVKKLETLEKDIETFKGRISSTENITFKDLQKTVDQSLSSPILTVEQKTKALSEKLDRYFSLFGEKGTQYGTNIKRVFEEVITDSNLNPEQRVKRINAEFEKLGKTAPPEIKKNLDKIRSEVVESVQRIDGTFTGELSKVVDTVDRKFTKLVGKQVSDKVRNGFAGLGATFVIEGEKLGQEIGNILDHPLTSLQTKIEQINFTFGKLAEGAPEEAAERIREVQAAVIDVLERAEPVISETVKRTGDYLYNLIPPETVNRIKNGFVELGAVAVIEGEKINQEVKAILDDPQASLETKIEQINTTFNKLLENVPEETADKIRETQESIVSTLENAVDPVSQAVNNVSQRFKDFGSQIQQVLGDPGTAIDAKIQQINTMFAGLIKDAPEDIRDNIIDVEATVIEGLERVKSSVESEASTVDSDLGNIAGEETREEARSNINNLIEVASEELERLRGVATGVVAQASTGIKTLADGKVQSVVADNMRGVSNVVRNEFTNKESIVSQGVDKVNTKLRSLGDSAGVKKMEKSFGSLTSLLSNLDPRISRLSSVGRDFNRVLEDMGAKGGLVAAVKKAMTGATVAETTAEAASIPVKGKSLVAYKGSIIAAGVLSTARKDLDMTNWQLIASEKLLGITTGATGKQQILSAKLNLGLAKGKKMLAGATSLLSKGIGILLKSLATLAKFLAPLLIKIAAVAGVLWLVHKALQSLIPAYGRATDSNLKFAHSIDESNKKVKNSREEIEKLTKSLEELNKEREDKPGEFRGVERKELQGLSTNAIIGLTGASREEVAKLRKELVEEMVPDSKSFQQGWTAPVVDWVEWLRDTVSGGLDSLSLIPVRIGALTADVIANLTERIPVIGGIARRVSDSVNNFITDMRTNQAQADQDNRKFFNNVRESFQQIIAGPAREAAREATNQVQELVHSTDKLVTAYESGGAAFGENSELLRKAAEEQRALSADELSEFLSNERRVNEVAREEIQKTIELRQEELEDIKDPAARAEMERGIKMLQQRNIELENGLELFDQHRQNINAMLQQRDINDATRGEEELLRRVNQIYDNLSENAKERFAELGDLTIDAEGNITELAGNLANSSQRRAAIAYEGARAGFLETIENLQDPELGIDQDKFANDLFDTLDAVDQKVAEGVVDFEAGEAIKQQYRNMLVDIDGQEGIAESFLRPEQLKSLEEQSIEALRTITDRNIEIKAEEAAVIQALQEQNLMSGVDASRKIADINQAVGEARIADEEKILQMTIERFEEGSQQAIDQRRKLEATRREVAIQGFNDRKTILEEEFALLQRQKDNEIALLENSAEKEKSILELRTSTLNLEQEAMQASQELAAAVTNLEVTALQNKLKFTGDIVEKAEIELQLAKDRQVALAAEQKFELQNLELQQELNKLGLEREKIELRVQKAQLDTQKILAQAQLAQARTLNLTKEEIEAIELQIAGLTQQKDLAEEQEKQLVKQGETQDIINQKQRESLRLRQEAAEQTTAAEVELAELEKINAGYEKQKEILRNNAQEVEVSGEARLQNLKSQEDILNSQTSIFQKQLDVIKQTQDISQRLFDMAKQSAMSGFRQRRIEREAAEERLKNLQAIQKIEEMNLSIQQQQRDIALVRKEIELDVAEAKQIAALAEAQAEQARLEADPRATAEERRAAALGVQAQETGLRGISSQREALGLEKALNEFVNQQERIQQRREFGVQQLEAEQALADTTRTRTDNRRVGQRALEMGRESAEEVGQLLSQFQMGQLSPSLQTQPQISGTGGRTSVLNQAVDSVSGLGSNIPGSMMNLNGRVEVTLDVKGDGAAKLDKDALQKAASDSLYEGLNKLFDYSLNRR